MYTRKNLTGQLSGKKKSRGGIAIAILFMISIAMSIYALASIMVLAAPEHDIMEEGKEEEPLEESKIVSEKKIEPGELIVKEIEEPKIPLIVVDAGHGGVDDGCLGTGVFEKDINLQIALRVKDKLEEKGFQVMMPRETDEYLAVEERVELANSYQADAYVSIHQNTYEGTDKSVNGIEIWYDGADADRDNEKLAKSVHQETIKCTGANAREAWGIADYCVTNRTLMPACLIETGFLSNPEECRKLSSSDYQDKIAEGIAAGVAQYFAS